MLATDGPFHLDLPRLTIPIDPVRLRGVESLGRPARWHVEVIIAHDQSVSEWIGEPATLNLADWEGRPARAVALEIIGVAERGAKPGEWGRRVRLALEPKLGRLRHRTRSRIYQDSHVTDIAQSVLGEHGVSATQQLTRTKRPRSYVVQYKETDLEFVQRILAEEGYAFWLQDRLGHDPVVVIADSPRGYTGQVHERLVQLPLRPDRGTSAGDEALLHLSRELRAHPKSAEVRHYDFERPLHDLTATAGPPDPKSQVYEHEPAYRDIDDTGDEARLVAARAARQKARYSGRATARRLAPGHIFHCADLAPSEFVTIAVRHRAHNPRFAAESQPVYECTFLALPAELFATPKRISKPPIQSLETATVVGPPGHVVHTDVYGRVKVHFHWDREGSRREQDSCWLRVAQTWAGASYGSQFVPRIGMEVLVAFLNGDPDRPVVTGALYNRIRMPPFPLPESQLKSGLRTDTGHGHHELSFDDTPEHERVHLRSERDFDRAVLRDELVRVGRDLSTHVGQQHSLVVGAGSESRVGGNLTAHVDGSELREIGANSQSRIAGDSTTEVAGRARLSCGGSASAHIDGAFEQSVAGKTALTFDGHVGVLVGRDQPSDADVTISGGLHVSAGRTLSFEAADAIELRVGETRLRLTGQLIELLAQELRARGSDQAFLAGAGQALELGRGAEMRADSIRLLSPSASLELDGGARVLGSQIELAKPGSLSRGATSGSRTKTREVRVRLLDDEHEPFRGAHYQLIAAGMRLEGDTNANGEIVARLPEGELVAAIRLWPRDYPTGPERRFDLQILEASPPPASTEAGAIHRLRALGFDVGEQGERLESALQAFQSMYADSHNLQPDGRLGDATHSALQEVFGS
ncbi:MAG: type VI secretion system tip protein TssI/VgrG [Polyangiaceae bacterium]